MVVLRALFLCVLCVVVYGCVSPLHKYNSTLRDNGKTNWNLQSVTVERFVINDSGYWHRITHIEDSTRLFSYQREIVFDSSGTFRQMTIAGDRSDTMAGAWDLITEFACFTPASARIAVTLTPFGSGRQDTCRIYMPDATTLWVSRKWESNDTNRIIVEEVYRAIP